MTTLKSLRRARDMARDAFNAARTAHHDAIAACASSYTAQKQFALGGATTAFLAARDRLDAINAKVWAAELLDRRDGWEGKR
jgi:hypothetical protein